MKIALISKNGLGKAILDHTEGNSAGIKDGTEGIFVDDVLISIGSTDLPVANTTVEAKNLVLNREMKTKVMNSLGIELRRKLSVSTVFSLFNGHNFSDWIEVSFRTRFMNGEVGPMIGFAQGTALFPEKEVEEALQEIPRIKQFLTDIGYRGEVVLFISAEYKVVDILLGHFIGHFAMYGEMTKLNCQGMLDFIFERVDNCTIYESCCLANFVSLPPFPLVNPQIRTNITVPVAALKHIWKVGLSSNQEVLLTVVHGNSVQESRRRMKRTMENLSDLNPNCQYRTDYGLGAKFLFCMQKYEKYQSTFLLDQNGVGGKGQKVVEVATSSGSDEDKESPFAGISEEIVDPQGETENQKND